MSERSLHTLVPEIVCSELQVTRCMQLETQLKQKTVQMDNLDNALSVTKKELAEQRREKELAEQVLVQLVTFHLTAHFPFIFPTCTSCAGAFL